MGVVTDVPAVALHPHRRQRKRGPARIVPTKPAACDDAGPAGAIEDELRLDGVRARVAGRVADRRCGRPGAAVDRRAPRTCALACTSAPACAASRSSSASSSCRSTCRPVAPPAKHAVRVVSSPHQTVLPELTRKPAASTAAVAPRRSNRFRQLGGSDSPSDRDRSTVLVKSWTEWPQLASRRAAAAPAGPPPTMTTSIGCGAIAALWPESRSASQVPVCGSV